MSFIKHFQDESEYDDRPIGAPIHDDDYNEDYYEDED